MSHHDLCPYCGQPWRLQRHKPINHLAAFCLPCAARKRRGIEWAWERKHKEREGQAAAWVPWEQRTPEQRAEAERDWAAMWPTEES